MKKSILFIVINGDGLGHLTRALTVAKRLKYKDSDLEIIFYTTSLATPIIRKLGFLCYYTPTMERMPEKVFVKDWENEVLLQLEKIIDLHHPSVAVFDGAYPITPILSPFVNSESIKKVWIKREGDRPNMAVLDVFMKYFDFILVPKEVGLEYSETSFQKQYVPPIIYIDEMESFTRQQVREQFGIKDDGSLWYVQLGNEGTNDNKGEIVFILNQLLQTKSNIILFGESIVGASLEISHERVITIRDYPNSKYFKGVDFAVSAAGYNTFHELLAFQVPTIFLPNRRVVKDDQVARARRAKALGVGVILNHSKEFADAYKKLLEEEQAYRYNLGKISFENGALEAAEFIIQLL